METTTNSNSDCSPNREFRKKIADQLQFSFLMQVPDDYEEKYFLITTETADRIDQMKESITISHDILVVRKWIDFMSTYCDEKSTVSLSRNRNYERSVSAKVFKQPPKELSYPPLYSMTICHSFQPSKNLH
jgi:hypothetical protein